MSLDFDNLIFKSVDRFTYVSNATGDIYFIVDDMNENGTLSNGEDIVFGTGANGRRISSMKKNKTTSYSFTNGFVSLNQMAVQSGSTVEIAETATIETPSVELIEVSEDGIKVSTSFTATGTTGAEILSLYKANSDGTQGAKFKQGSTASATEFAYSPLTKEITLPTGVFKKGDRVLVYYNYLTKGKKISNPSNKFSKDGRAILECTVCAPCDQETVYQYKLVIPYSTSSGAYDIAFGGDQVTHPFECQSILNPCDKKADLWYGILEEDE